MLTRINGVAFRNQEELDAWRSSSRKPASVTTARSAKRCVFS